MLVTSGRARLATDCSGSGPIDVLLLHAGGTDRHCWSAMASRLDSDARCISYDLRGHGATQYDEEPGWSHVTDATAVLDAYGVGACVVIGCSLGSMVAVDLVLAASSRVSALVLISPSVGGAPEIELEPSTAHLAAAAETASAAGDLDTANRALAHIWLDGPAQPEGRVGGDVRRRFLATNMAALRMPPPGPLRETDAPAWERLDEVGVSTLVLTGQHDLVGCRRRAAEMTTRLPDACLVELSGVAHLPQLEGSQTMLRAVHEFVRLFASRST